MHNLLLVEHDKGWLLLAFASCQRFGGEFRLYPDGRLQIMMNGEGRALPAGQFWQSEALLCLEGKDREALLAELAQRIEAEHGSLIGQVGERPSGWCSWYHYYADVSAADIRENLQVRAERFPALRYVQIDDGYQAKMGDWLTPSAKFEQGWRPWPPRSKAPAASPRSGWPLYRRAWLPGVSGSPRLVREGDDGLPLPSERVTYGGWRCTPGMCWMAPTPRYRLTSSGCFVPCASSGASTTSSSTPTSGAIHGGRFHDPTATRVEAYRRGMAAILRGAGEGPSCSAATRPSGQALGWCTACG